MITIYTKYGCPNCTMAKEFFKQNKVDVQLKPIEEYLGLSMSLPIVTNGSIETAGVDIYGWTKICEQERKDV